MEILVVCTGNVCRSPIAERLLAAGLRDRLGAAGGGVRVRSAGTAGWEGAAMEDGAARVLAERGVDPAGFIARRLTGEMVAAADLVLCAAREHRAAVARLQPVAARRAFTLPEIGHLLDGVGPAKVSDAGGPVALAAARRGRVPPLPAEGYDVPDPFGRDLPAFRACADLIAGCLARPLDLLAAAVSAG